MLLNFVFAGNDQDYYPVRSVYAFTNERRVTIRTRSDTTLEHDEKFALRIDPTILPDGIFGCITEVVVTIENDDGKLPLFVTSC